MPEYSGNPRIEDVRRFIMNYERFVDKAPLPLIAFGAQFPDGRCALWVDEYRIESWTSLKIMMDWYYEHGRRVCVEFIDAEVTR